MLNALLDILFPPSCALCSRYMRTTAAHSALCGRCRKKLTEHMNAPSQDGHYFLGPYRGILRDAVKKIKYEKKSSLIEVFGRLLAKKLAGDRWDCIVPIPIRFSSFYRRGFHQTYLLSLSIQKNLAHTIPIQLALKQRHGVRHQTTVKSIHRHQNIAGAFRALKGVEGKKILLVDDVVTSGATTEEAAKTLLDAGAAEVEFAYIGRAPRWHRHVKNV